MGNLILVSPLPHYTRVHMQTFTTPTGRTPTKHSYIHPSIHPFILPHAHTDLATRNPYSLSFSLSTDLGVAYPPITLP